MKNWVKIIELKKHDVLIQRLSDDDDLEHISATIKMDGVLVSLKFGYGEDEKLADEGFAKFNESQATELVKNIKAMM